jgi:hypothetical protein
MTIRESSVVETNTINYLKYVAPIHNMKPPTIVQSNLLVPLTKSNKLASFRKQSHPLLSSEKDQAGIDARTSQRLNKETSHLLREAQEQITTIINTMMALYPSAKKNKLFSLKYGSPESIKQLSIADIFSTLKVTKPKQFKPIENLNFFGDQTSLLKKPKWGD